LGHYDAFDSTPYRTHMRALACLRPGQRVLEVGCSTGALSERMRALGCTVVGIEQRADAAERARAFCESVLVGDVERMPLALPKRSFDVLLLLDVLEHLVDPVAAVARLVPLVRDAGIVVVALPNVAHWSIRGQLVRGRFEYVDSGILDRTHLHLYTLRTAERLLGSAGLEILEKDIIPDTPFLRFRPRVASLNYKIARLLPNLLSTESFFVTRPSRTASSR